MRVPANNESKFLCLGLAGLDDQERLMAGLPAQEV
jgi:hypothetical protein